MLIFILETFVVQRFRNCVFRKKKIRLNWGKFMVYILLFQIRGNSNWTDLEKFPLCKFLFDGFLIDEKLH